MLKISLSKYQLNECLNSFCWTFKIGDNILYNLDLIFQLVDDHNKLAGRKYAKPISILCVSVIEGALVDFLERLDSATRHFPSKLDSKKKDIKKELEGKKNDFEIIYKGKVYKYKRLKNFGYKELIKFYEDFKILGSRSADYQILQELGRFRNRVHIQNYFRNFEQNESCTFSENRSQRAIDYMESVFKYLSKNYPRP
ncbi:MAG TPA: hypothetical protein VJH33_01060 [Candidatus Paceibacterota bacterium]